MFGALNPGFEACMTTLKLVMNVVGELETEKNSCGIARFPCDSTASLSLLLLYEQMVSGKRKKSY